MPKICDIEFENSSEIYKFDMVARQSNGSVLCSVGDAVMMSTVVCETNKNICKCQDKRWIFQKRGKAK